MKIKANLVDIHQRRIYPAEIAVDNGKIQSITPIDDLPVGAGFILPGFIDAHVHIESSMLPPTEFARLAVAHGTVATVSDPHEIANVLGIAGVYYMLEEAGRSPLKFCFGAPSCVPATAFETAGATLDVEAVEELLRNPAIGYLSEMMNFPGVLFSDAEVMAKLEAAKRLGKPIDGHAPGLRGKDAQRYFAAGIRTDHECFIYEEGYEKARLGVKILIREGSAARNFEALWPLLKEFPQQIMFCSDDKHPDDLIRGHIDQLVIRALVKRCDLFDVLRAACLHPVEHYQLPVGLLREGETADFIIVENLQSFKVRETWIDGRCVAVEGKSLIEPLSSATPNNFKVLPKKVADFAIPAADKPGKIRVIRALDGEIVTEEEHLEANRQDGQLLTDPGRDLLKIAVVNRYVEKAAPALGFVRGFGLRRGAIASSVAHDSHNIVAVGTDDQSLCDAVNAIIRVGGGIAATDGRGNNRLIALPIAGLMSPEDGYRLASRYAELDAWTKDELGCSLHAPFMTLSFLALPVIPALKMTDRGLFDVQKFDFVGVSVK